MIRGVDKICLSGFLATVLLAVAGCGSQDPSQAFPKGKKYFDRQQYEKARDAFDLALTAEDLPSLRGAEIYNYLGLIASLQGRPADAEHDFSRARELEPEFFDPAYNLGLIKLEQGDPDLAESFLYDAADREPGQAYALEWLGHLQLKRGRLTDARRMYSDALSRAGTSPRILTALGNVEWKESGEPGDALTYLMQALEMDPEYAPALFNVARIYDLSLNRDQARAYYQQYLAVAQDVRRIEFSRARIAGRKTETEESVVEANPPPALEPPEPLELSEPVDVPEPALPPELPELSQEEKLVQMVSGMLAQAEQRKRAGSEGQALNFCLQAAARARSAPELREQALRKAVDLCFDMGRAHYELARFLEEQNRLPDALSSYKQAAVLEKSTKYVHLDLAALAVRMNEDDAALSSLRAAADIDPNDPEVSWKLANLLDELGMKDKAVAAYTGFNNRFPEDPRGVKAAQRLKILKPAPVQQISLRSGLTVPAPKPGTSQASMPTNRDDALKAYNRGTAYLKQKDFTRAVFFYRRAIELDSSLEAAYYNLGLTYRQTGDLVRSADMFTACIDLKPDMVDAYYNLALVLHDLKRDQEAINALKTLTRKQVDYGPAYYLAGVIFASYPEQRTLARRYYTQFTQLANPEDPYLPAARQWLAENP